MADQEEPPVPLPSAPLIELASNATLQPPLTRRGYGPGLIIITPAGLHADHKSRLRRTTPRKSEEGDSKPEEQPSPPPDTLDPLPQKKWAEEGYAVVEVKLAGLSEEEMGGWTIGMALGRAIEALVDLETCNVKDKFGLIGKRACLLSISPYCPIPIPKTRTHLILIELTTKPTVT